MTRPADRDDFFVGYRADIGWPIARVALMTGIAFVVCMLLLGAILVRATDDPGSGAYVDGADEITGIIRARPYPILVTADTRAFLLAGEGKQGVQQLAALHDGQRVTAGGALLKRGALDMLLVGGPLKVTEADGRAPRASTSPTRDLGRWRIAGEICDGKCFAGAMKPGSGLAHKACANLCLDGGLPPVLVTRDPVEGFTYFLMARADGGPLTREIDDMTAVPVSIEGRLLVRDALPILLVDQGAIRRVP